MSELNYGHVITIDANATSDPAQVPTNQWQRKPSGQSFSDISGETSDTYEVAPEDRNTRIRLVQKLGGARVFSNELQVTNDPPPPLSSGYIGVHLKNNRNLKVRYDCPSSSVKFYYKANIGDEWQLDLEMPAGMNQAYNDDQPGYYAWESTNLVWVAFNGSNSFVEFDLLEESDFTNVTELNHLFNGCKYFNQDLDWMKIPNVTTIAYMFGNCQSMLGNVNFETPKVTNMQNCFEELNSGSAAAWNMDLSNWDTSNVKNMMYMFRGRPGFNHTSVTTWDTSNVTQMDGMFADCAIFDQDLTGWCVEKIKSEPSSSPLGFSKNSPLTNAHKPNWGAPC